MGVAVKQQCVCCVYCFTMSPGCRYDTLDCGHVLYLVFGLHMQVGGIVSIQ